MYKLLSSAVIVAMASALCSCGAASLDSEVAEGTGLGPLEGKAVTLGATIDPIGGKEASLRAEWMD